MSRRRAAEKREILPDAKFGDAVVAKFINSLMYEGKRSVAETIVYSAFDEIKRRANSDPLKVFHEALDNVKPAIEVRSRRVGGATYQVPVPVPQKRQISLAYRWLLGAARAKKGRPMHLKLADELYAAFKGEGEAMKKREDVHKMAEANKAFAHLAY